MDSSANFPEMPRREPLLYIVSGKSLLNMWPQESPYPETFPDMEDWFAGTTGSGKAREPGGREPILRTPRLPRSPDSA